MNCLISWSSKSESLSSFTKKLTQSFQTHGVSKSIINILILIYSLARIHTHTHIHEFRFDVITCEIQFGEN